MEGVKSLVWKLPHIFKALTLKVHATPSRHVILTVTAAPMARNNKERMKNRVALLLANVLPTDDTLRHTGHLANALFRMLN